MRPIATDVAWFLCVCLCVCARVCLLDTKMRPIATDVAWVDVFAWSVCLSLCVYVSVCWIQRCRAYFNVLGDLKSVLEGLVTRA